MRNFLSAALLLFGLMAHAQNDASTRYADLISVDDLKKHLTIIAGEEMEGRETGTEGQRKAAEYIRNHFSSLGLTAPASLAGYEQMYPLYTDSIIAVSLTAGKWKALYGTDYISPALANDNGKAKSSHIVFAGYGIDDKNYNDYSNLNVKNKIVVIMLGEPKQDGKYLVSGGSKSSEWSGQGMNKKIALAAEKGAKAVFMINPAQELFTQKTAESSKKTSIYYPRPPKGKKVNYALISHEFAKKLWGASMEQLIAAAKLSQPFSKEQLSAQKIKTSFSYKESKQVVMASNVLGVVEGSDKKDEYVFLTAHYDHLGKRDGKIYYGADDDGSGTVAVMQMATAFKRARDEGKGPRRSVVFMLVSGEEKGLWGSEFYSDNPVYPLEKTTVDLNIDMIGRVDTERMKDDTLNYVYVVGHDKISTELPIVNEAVNQKYSGLTLDYKFDDPNDPNRIYFRSDHYNFARKGVPVLFFYDGMLKSDYHKPTDTVDKIYWGLFQKRAKMIFHTAWEMANRDNMLVRDLPIPTATR